MQEIEKMIETLVQSFAKAAEEGKSLREAALIAELALRSQYSGERVYVAGHPKARRLYEAQQLGTTTMTMMEKSRTIGVSVRHLTRLTKGK
jgi:hypothetical protein